MSDTISSKGIRAYLIGLVNAKEGLVLNADEMTFEAPVLVDPTILDFNDPDRRNTMVQITRAATTDTPSVDITVRYNRLSMERLFALRSREFTVAAGTRLSDYLPVINGRINGDLSVQDIEDVDLVSSDQSVSVMLRAAENSLYTFGEVELMFHPAEEDIPEDDDMHYTAYPLNFYARSDSEGNLQKISLSIDAGCGYPMKLMSSHPESSEVVLIEDLSALEFQDAALHYIFPSNSTPGLRFGDANLLNRELYDNINSVRTYDPEGVLIANSLQVISHNNGQIELTPNDGDPIDLGAAEAVSVRLKFTHPSVNYPVYMYFQLTMPS